MTTNETIWITRDVNELGYNFETEDGAAYGSDTVEGAIAIARSLGYTDIKVER